MSIKKKEIADKRLRAYPSTSLRLKVQAAKKGITIAEHLDVLSKVAGK